jgi:hypothetical protein
MEMGNVSFGGTAAIVTSVALIFGLVALTWALARERKVSFAVELGKHCAAALAVILASKGIAP